MLLPWAGLWPRLACLDQELLGRPQQLDHGLHAVIERLAIGRGHLAGGLGGDLNGFQIDANLGNHVAGHLAAPLFAERGRENVCWPVPTHRQPSPGSAARPAEGS